MIVAIDGDDALGLVLVGSRQAYYLVAGLGIEDACAKVADLEDQGWALLQGSEGITIYETWAEAHAALQERRG